MNKRTYVYPKYDSVIEVRKKCIPYRVCVIEKIAIQNLLEHTAKRTILLHIVEYNIVATIFLGEQRYEVLLSVSV